MGTTFVFSDLPLVLSVILFQFSQVVCRISLLPGFPGFEALLSSSSWLCSSHPQTFADHTLCMILPWGFRLPIDTFSFRSSSQLLLCFSQAWIHSWLNCSNSKILELWGTRIFLHWTSHVKHNTQSVRKANNGKNYIPSHFPSNRSMIVLQCHLAKEYIWELHLQKIVRLRSANDIRHGKSQRRWKHTLPKC